MQKEMFEIELVVKLPFNAKWKPHDLTAGRKFSVHTTRALLFRSLEAMENHLTKIYAFPSSEETQE